MIEDGRGERLDDPFYFIQQVFGLPGDQHKTAQKLFAYNDNDDEEADFLQTWVNEYDQYENVTFNIWLYKGEHHFV